MKRVLRERTTTTNAVFCAHRPHCFQRLAAIAENTEAILLHGYTFGKVARLVYVTAPLDRNVISEQLERDYREQGREYPQCLGYIDDVVSSLSHE